MTAPTYSIPGTAAPADESPADRAHTVSEVLAQSEADAVIVVSGVRTREIVKGVRLQLAEFLPPLPGEVGARGSAPAPSLFEILEEVERRVIVDMLERTGWNQTEAAERFLVPLSTLNQKIKRLGIDVRRRGRGNDSLSASSGK